MNIQDFSNMIDRYLEGNANEQETAFIQKWIMLRRKDEPVLPDTDRQRIASEMWSVVGKETGSGGARRLRLTHFLLRCAAILVTAVAGVALFMMLHRNHRGNELTAVAYRSVETPPGVMKKIKLTDGSVVYLFPGSAVKIPADYGEQERVVKVAGRAFFEVQGNSGKRFQVQTGQLTTTVLGTSFEVRQQGHKAVVSVRSGKVRVQYGNRRLSDVEAGTRLVYDTVQAALQSEKISGTESFSWTSGTLSFSQVPLAEACKTLGDWFNAGIIIRNGKLGSKKITANLSGQSLETAMQILAQTAGCNYKQDRGNIIVY